MKTITIKYNKNRRGKYMNIVEPIRSQEKVKESLYILKKNDRDALLFLSVYIQTQEFPDILKV